MQELGKTVGLTAMTGSRRLTSEKKRSSHRAKERRLGRDPSKHKGFTSKKKTLRLPASCLLEFPTDRNATAGPSRHGFSVTASSWDEVASLHRPAKGRRGRLGGPEGRWRSFWEVPKAFAIATAINPLILRGKLTDQTRLVPSYGTQLPPGDLSRISMHFSGQDFSFHEKKSPSLSNALQQPEPSGLATALWPPLHHQAAAGAPATGQSHTAPPHRTTLSHHQLLSAAPP